MTMHYIYVLGFTLLLQQALGSWLENRLNAITSPLLDPINDLNEEIQAKLAELEIKQDELRHQKLYLSAKLKSAPQQCLTENLLAHANLHSQWDLDGCLNLTGDWRDGVLFGMKFTIQGINITTQLWTTFNSAMNCSELNIFKMVPCYYETIKALIGQVSYLKEKMAPLIKEGNQLLVTMRKDFNYCLGIPQTLQYRIEKYLDNCIKNSNQIELEENLQRLRTEEFF